MILWNVGSAREEIKDLVEDGICDATDPRILKALNLAIRSLIVESDWKGTLVAYHICVENCCFTAPRDVEAIREVWLNCQGVGRVRPIWFEYLEHGPGVSKCCSSPCSKDLVDMGIFPTHRTPTYAWPLLVLSDCCDDDGIEVTIRGLNEHRIEVTGCQTAVEYSPGAVLTTDNSCPRYTDSRFTDIISIQKNSPSKGYIRVFSYDPNTYKYQQLTVIHPADTKPGYRRYKLPQTASNSIVALAKITANELVHDSDLLPIQNMEAIRHMLRSMKADDAMEPGISQRFEDKAIKKLTAEKKNFDNDQSGYLQIEGGYALGDIGLGRTR